MTHADIEADQIAERYLQGKLSAEQAEQFEEHYLSCPECLDRLEATEGLAQSLKAAAAAGVTAAATVTAVRQLALFTWLARLGRARQAALLMSVFLVVLVAPGVVLVRDLRLDWQLHEARAVLAARASGERGDRDLAAARRDLALAREQRAALAQDLAQAREPQADVPILYLGSERGGGSGGAGGGEPAYRLRLPRQPGTVVVSIPIEAAAGRSWQVVLGRAASGAGAGGAEIWRSAPLAIREDTVAVAIPSSVLAPGDYALALEAVAAPGDRGNGSGGPTARFTFRALPPLPG